MNKTINEAIVAIPLDIDEIQQESIRNASLKVGLQILTFIDKATAAVIHYKLD